MDTRDSQKKNHPTIWKTFIFCLNLSSIQFKFSKENKKSEKEKRIMLKPFLFAQIRPNTYHHRLMCSKLVSQLRLRISYILLFRSCFYFFLFSRWFLSIVDTNAFTLIVKPTSIVPQMQTANSANHIHTSYILWLWLWLFHRILLHK